MLKNLKYLEKYNSDPTFADYLMPRYRKFEIEYNDIIKPKYQSIVDEAKRYYWISKKIKIKNWKISKVHDRLVNLIFSETDVDSSKVNQNNEWKIRYFYNNKTNQLFKLKLITLNDIQYSTLGQNAIMQVAFKLKISFWNKKNVILKYLNGFVAKELFSYLGYASSKQLFQIKANFIKNYQLVFKKIENVFNNEEEVCE
ncbi:hypothetical protein [Spiroplasma sp. SV19]|uniref:hypothetical protein n=1 Tax=Spiroplasma sp. SV19 TaxID=2570468 RepID=UPI0024B6FA95|nr:hypothetical protein [Spiroplasma sp. SV19]WHQ36557.1 hypothetical protein E7Y35_01245 [Spiroplasma sp. SV19]